MSNVIGNDTHYDESLVEKERAAERENGPELSVARPSDGDFREFHMPPNIEAAAGAEPQTPEELEEARNPLGYNASEATREELDGADEDVAPNRAEAGTRR